MRVRNQQNQGHNSRLHPHYGASPFRKSCSFICDYKQKMTALSDSSTKEKNQNHKHGNHDTRNDVYDTFKSTKLDNQKETHGRDGIERNLPRPVPCLSASSTRTTTRPPALPACLLACLLCILLPLIEAFLGP
ncbi:hypothetical protein K461DRAFT_100324 [Myriangium duriaei CBS 260.36]|uniref:Uncharacterized protein n=1 Tax=Myriangium duriaei CBS 260.36 TaxID=1168546 RepID=A0A9P4MIV6_9PEZI|nr:hypothetical protein K461DRAFT_100324 [Myriangium duriaei CBS 260.36]